MRTYTTQQMEQIYNRRDDAVVEHQLFSSVIGVMSENSADDINDLNSIYNKQISAFDDELDAIIRNPESTDAQREAAFYRQKLWRYMAMQYANNAGRIVQGVNDPSRVTCATGATQGDA